MDRAAIASSTGTAMKSLPRNASFELDLRKIAIKSSVEVTALLEFGRYLDKVSET